MSKTAIVFWEELCFDGGVKELWPRKGELLGECEPICQQCGEREYWEDDKGKHSHARPNRKHAFQPVTLSRIRVLFPDTEQLLEITKRIALTGLPPGNIPFEWRVIENVRRGKAANCYTFENES